jgi:hypothetical protein
MWLSESAKNDCDTMLLLLYFPYNVSEELRGDNLIKRFPAAERKTDELQRTDNPV